MDKKPQAGSSVPDPDRAAAREAMERYAQGDQDAFAALYDLVANRLWGYLCRRLPPECAEDVMQQTFVRMHQARGRFRLGSEVFPWMYSIAYRLAVDCMRRKGLTWRVMQEGPVLPAGGTPSPDAEAEAKELGLLVIAALEALPARQRAAFELVREEGLTHEAAETLGTTVSAIKSLVHRAIESIKRSCGLELDE